MNHTAIIASLIVAGGIVGGTINYFRSYNKETGNTRKYWTCVLVGIGASSLVPLFLSMISSDLIINTRQDDKHFFTFVGLCLVAAIFSNRFIDSIGEKVLKEVEQTKEEVNEIKNKNEMQQAIIDTINDQISTTLPALLSKLKETENDNGSNAEQK